LSILDFGLHRRKVPPASDGVGVSRSKASLADRKDPLVQGTVEVALVAQDTRETVEALGGLEVVGAKAGLTDGKGTLAQAAGTADLSHQPNTRLAD
jgi:hypothetical protein